MIEYTVDYGKEVKLDCEILSTPLHNEVYWVKTITSNDTRKITSSSRMINITPNGSTLNIKEARSSDAAKYRCVAVNSVGEGYSSEITIIVRGGKCIMLYI